jgi:hypothetical protein
MNKCKDCDSDCYDIEDKQHCYDYRPDRGYCPYLEKHMLKKLRKLKTIKQILSEYKNKGYKINQYDKSSQINIDGGGKVESCIIAEAMFKYFGTEINVYVGKESVKYEYYMKTMFNKWWFREDWFLPEVEVELLEDKLFEL